MSNMIVSSMRAGRNFFSVLFTAVISSTWNSMQWVTSNCLDNEWIINMQEMLELDLPKGAPVLS